MEKERLIDVAPARTHTPRSEQDHVALVYELETNSRS
jgi:hypothetical protein